MMEKGIDQAVAAGVLSANEAMDPYGFFVSGIATASTASSPFSL